MTSAQIHSLDIRLLRYFAVVAEENNMSRAAQRLFMSQPPLSRHIRQLEERLGVTLFERHSKGLTLTNDGVRVLEIIRPLLAQQEKTYQALSQLAQTEAKSLRLGLTTAFEQGVFAALEAQIDVSLQIIRHSSPELVRQVRRGKLDAALVALPLETSNLVVSPLDWHEPLIAALPAHWPEAEMASLSLALLNSRPLFWFRRERNPVFFDYTRQIFQREGYAPSCLEEPLEHDVLLARIAHGDGLSILPSSFAAIHRQGVVFRPLQASNLCVTAGLAMLPENAARFAWLTSILSEMFSSFK
ncbi:LysR family transcriptional regulator [Escherichia fergusonii]|uniref:LysR family transcriptional regulator n=1 Tax=Escherichia fergusonii TaxID=564 RepID=UPI00061457D7|nr:LysR family transcriptional regulator [Escherichia fergusonii]EHG6149526.1 LysR family transcriptional regulator [Escherichia fergusonii]EHG6159583.1 LysR family transcriptional regulator [Escherichia fergusonii]EHG6205085.1 LysR family transcriptional regulator [Escherichia fergusonii]EHK3067374.1 LysR family transcriptional regulator [Escherichia fergusonii]EHK3070272.1 LysR family transcriptional regulator [Escherichia fergusonii]